jgi:hypothetical protein
VTIDRTTSGTESQFEASLLISRYGVNRYACSKAEVESGIFPLAKQGQNGSSFSGKGFAHDIRRDSR